MQAADTTPGWWRKSSYSGYNADCVEVGHSGAAIGVRDTKDRQGAILMLSVGQWDAFLGGVRRGELGTRQQ